MDIVLYEEWMKPQIARLFSVQYGIKEEDFSELIGNFYEHPFQKDKCIRIVALEGKAVIGFQSFFYWPYLLNGMVVNSYQSGNSLVHEHHRGKGIFQKLLNYVDEHKDKLAIDVFIGFPVDQSVGSFIRNKWINIFNLQWFVKSVNPLSVLFPLNVKKLNIHFPPVEVADHSASSTEFLKLSHTMAFNAWRATHYDPAKYFSFVYKKGRDELILKLKTNIRKKIIKELIIGDVITSSYELSFLEEAFQEFLKKAKKIYSLSIISIAYNTNADDRLSIVLAGKGFKKIDKQIYFCVKPFSGNASFTDASKWMVYRGDIDTW
jgi:GNAT superfamily N-acetyltransferase